VPIPTPGRSQEHPWVSIPNPGGLKGVPGAPLGAHRHPRVPKGGLRSTHGCSLPPQVDPGAPMGAHTHPRRVPEAALGALCHPRVVPGAPMGAHPHLRVSHRGPRSTHGCVTNPGCPMEHPSPLQEVPGAPMGAHPHPSVPQ